MGLLLLGFRVVAVLLVILQAGRAKSTLNVLGTYGSVKHARKCLDISWAAATYKLLANPGSAPNCLRLAFHDAGSYTNSSDIGGANGSILIELSARKFLGNNGLQQCGELMPSIITLIKANGCPQIRAADAIQVTAAAAVYASGGPICPVLMGRPDSNTTDPLGKIPSPCTDVSGLIGSFSNMGFHDPVKALAVLSGAHNIGRSRVTGQSGCSQGINFMTATPAKFDGHYYTEVVKHKGNSGWFFSDKTLAASGAPTAKLMKLFSSNHTAWTTSWCQSFQELSLLGVNPTPAGYNLLSGWVPSVNPANITIILKTQTV